jgi:uncharacterized protein YbjT (DUF2867 family)
MALDKTILVTGATGAQGGSVARHLLAGGSFGVRALTRNPKSDAAQALTKAGAQVVQGDLTDSASVRRALDGCYGVFGLTNYWEHFDKEYDHGKVLVETVATAGVQHFVFSTLPSVEKVAPHLNVPHFELKAKLEDYARTLGIPATYAHVAFYFDNFLAFFPPRKQEDGSYVIGLPQGDTPLAGIAVADTGGVVARIFEQRDRFLDKAVPIAGDELPLATYAEILSRVTGRKVAYAHIPREVFAKFDFPGASEIADMFEFYRVHLPSRQPDIALGRTLYPKLQSFEQWAQANREAIVRSLEG